MRQVKPLALVAGVAMLALAACGGGGSEGSGDAPDKAFRDQGGVTKDPRRAGPAAEIEGAKSGWHRHGVPAR